MIRQSRVALAFGIALVAALALVVAAYAQTPTEGDATAVPTEGAATPTGEETPGEVQETNAHVFVVVPEGEFEDGDTFDAEVRIEDAEHIAAFSFSLGFDPGDLTIPDQDANAEGVQFGSAIGDFLTTSERTNIECSAPEIESGNRVSVECVTLHPPVCLGGPEGASGSGTLGIIQFAVISSGDTELSVPASKVVLDDVEPCTSGQLVQVEPANDGATVNVKSEGFPWLILIAVVAVVAVLLAGGAFAYVRTRQSTSTE